MKRILVTGAAGYIGALLCPQLSQAGYEVIALDLSQPLSSCETFFQDFKIDMIPGDAADESCLKRCLAEADVIIPLAALVGAPICERQPEKARRSNLEAIQLLNRLRRRDQFVIFPMTNNGYRLPAGQTHVTEETPFETDSLYTQTKFQAEQELMASGNAISFRLASLFGFSPSMRWDLLLHFLIQRACQDGRLSLYESGFKRNFVHAQDVVDVFLFGVKNAQAMKNQIYNVALEAGNLIKYDLALKIQKSLPDLVIETAEQSKDPDARNFYVSTEKLKRAGFEPKRSIEDGIREVLKGLKVLQPA